eukprot:Plantae.Rhodophyta-Purpureofilum_apyrenoidigerum.ctg3892.p1 GENE.Plantae.Rhodophyta-Purpureofilum_apyrenoidigerum.ctg3892~~Plantae.Rhodophyta-Purpureofilum_apyrenoidigerum.ctg3892.p1  ORF type:complete len:254 (+),score=31.55 Plantae.Rhodophyta-Purpureofilum_apyrenoidigerum.ctg3892:384-1145(+)
MEDDSRIIDISKQDPSQYRTSVGHSTSLYISSNITVAEVLALASAVLLCVAVFTALRNIYFDRKRRERIADESRKYAKLMVVLGSGGHTAEALQMIADMFDATRTFSEIVYIVAETDAHSAAKARALHAQKGEQMPFSIFKLPRAREVGQSYFTSVFTTLFALLSAGRLVFVQRPTVLLVNGPGTCVPIAVWTIFLNSLNISRCSTIYVESVARVETLSLSGQILYPIVKRFIVQWPQLRAKYPLAEHYGRLV